MHGNAEGDPQRDGDDRKYGPSRTLAQRAKHERVKDQKIHIDCC